MRLDSLLLGVFVAVFLLVGRWSPWPVPYTSSDSLVLFYEPRFWLVAMIGLLSLVVAANQTGVRLPHPFFVSRRRWAILAIGLLVYLISATLWSPDPTESIWKAYEVALIGVVVIGLSAALRNGIDGSFRLGFWGGVLGVGVGLIVLGIVSFGGMSRLAVLGGGPNVFGRTMGLVSIACLAFLAMTGRLLSWLWILLTVVAFILTLLSGSRGALLSTTCGLLVALVAWRVRVVPKVFVLLLTLLGGVAILGLTEVGQQAIEVFQYRILELTIERGYSTGRLDMYRDAIEVGMDNFLFGAGLKGFDLTTGQVYPHNIVLEHFAEGGVVGLFGFFALLLGLVLNIFRYRFLVETTFVAAFVVALVFSQTSGDLFDSRGVFIFGLLAMTPLATISKEKYAQTSVVHERYIHIFAKRDIAG